MEANRIKEMKLVSLEKELLKKVYDLLIDDYWIDPIVVTDKKWEILTTDDNQIFDEDAINLAAAMKAFGINSFYIVPVCYLTDFSIIKPALMCEPTKEDIESFQGDSNSDWYDWTFSECVFFDKGLTFLLFRTGDSVHTICAGSSNFIDIACANKEIWWEYDGPHSTKV